MWLLFRKQPRTGKDRGSGRRFELRNPSGRETGAVLFVIVGRRSRYHSPFVSHHCDKSPGTSYQPRHLLPVPTPPAPVPVTRYQKTLEAILYRRIIVRIILLYEPRY